MIDNEKCRVLGIVGNPLRQSMSPYLHNYWIKKYKVNAYYLPFPIKKVKGINISIKTLNFIGLNVTIPFKKVIIKELDSIDKNAKSINAVNTIVNKGNKTKGYNTDIIGFKKGLQKTNMWDKKRPVFVFGAGGAAEAILHFLKIEKIKDITIFNRTKSRANKILRDYKQIKFVNNINNLNLKEAGLIINTTSLGMIGYPELDLDLKSINKNAVVYDIVYNPINTKLILNAKKEKLLTVSGLDMFIEQAKSSFEIWFNIKPKDDAKLIANIKKEITKK